MKTYEIQGTYGSNNTPCTVFVAETNRGDSWYVVDGSVNVNCTPNEIVNGVNVEELTDISFFTWSSPISSLEELELAVEN